jgi:hypothetical protein
VQTPLWVYLLAPAATLVAGLVGVVAAFLVGRYQGRAQTQHDQSVRVVVEVRRRTLVVIDEMSAWPEPIGEDAPEDIDHSPAMWEVRELVAYYRANTPWLDRQAVTNIDPIIDGLTRASWEVFKQWARGSGVMEAQREWVELVEGYDEPKGPAHISEMVAKIREVLEKPPDEPKVQDLVAERLEPLAAQLEVEARRLIGTHESRWQKLWRS